ncbi:hypothetical protein ACHHYP_16821 [Achlya hypogyna]|uniref:Uncharacterized protein n=1 Tax=Achlya hypogyna TaxID=1202772 RepID=A0A1V9Y5S0_ACHHY|nr:hypothetical protein ACHHYP_16821 [Achlya hypogyna]
MQTLVAGLSRARAAHQAGDIDGAVALWRALLKDAYAAQYHAAMFVVSKNLGDAVVDEAEAMAFYEYALEVATTCDVMSDPGLRPAIASIAVAMQLIQVFVCPSCHVAKRVAGLCAACDQSPRDICATCTESFAVTSLILDANDGELYCQPCYDAYYAQNDESDEDNADVDDVADEAEDGCDAAKKDTSQASLCTVCHLEKASIRDWQGSFFCQHCFIKATQAKIAQDLQAPVAVPTSDPAPATRWEVTETAAMPTPALPTAQSPETASSSAADVTTGNGQSADEAPTKRIYSREFLLTLRQLHQACPPSVRASPVFRDSIPPPKAKAAPRKPSEKPLLATFAVEDQATMLCAALRLAPEQFDDELSMYEHYYRHRGQ